MTSEEEKVSRAAVEAIVELLRHCRHCDGCATDDGSCADNCPICMRSGEEVTVQLPAAALVRIGRMGETES